MGKTFSTGLLTNGLAQDSSNNIGIGGAANASFKLQVTGTTNLTDNLTMTIASGTKSIGFGGNTIAAAANALIYSDTNYLVLNSKAGSPLYLNFDNANASSTINMFNGKFILTQAGAATFTAASGVIANFVGASGKYGQIYSDANAAVFGASTTTSLGNNYMYVHPTSNFISFITNANERMVITSGGNVGIGTSSPDVPLEVYKSAGGPTLRITNSGTGTGSGNGFHIGSNLTAPFDVAFVQNEDASQVFYTNATERMRITSEGYLQISTVSTIPSTNNLIYSYSSNGYFYIQGGTTGLALAGSGNRANAIYLNTTLNIIAFHTNDTGEKMRITSGGVVLINQTSLSAASAGGKFQVATDMLSTGSGAGYFWENRSGGVTSNSNWYGWYTTSGTIYLYNGAGNIASINTSSGAYTALSDINKKKDFEQSTIGLNAILGLNPTLYRMKSDNELANKELGFIAQEVKDFIPQAYVETEDFIGLNYNAIVAALVKSVQEQQAQIEELKQIVATK
jgi:hypothetical protein